MVNAQEWLDQWYPWEGTCQRNNEVPQVNNFGKVRSEITELFIAGKELEGTLDLTDFSNLENLYCCSNQLINFDLSENVNLRKLDCAYNQLTSVEFLNNLPNPEKLETLTLYNNNIQVDIAIFSKFINLKFLKIGTTKYVLAEGKHNKFFGSLKAYQNLTKLENICIEATDVNEGLEYLPASLAQVTKGGGWYTRIECSPHLECFSPNDPQPKCKAIQDQLRPFNYDLEAWQLAHFDLMLEVNPSNLWKLKPGLFTGKEQKDKLIAALIAKIEETWQELGLVRANEAQKVKEIARLESKINLLQEAVAELEEQNAQLEEELQMEREEAEKALEKAKEWRERQLKEITGWKDKEISELKNNLETKKSTQNKLQESAKQKNEEITVLKENQTQLWDELATTKTQLATAQNLANNLDKTEEGLSWIKVIMVWGFLVLISLQILFGVWTLWGNRRNRKKRLVK
jgi:hypothetical protein